MSHSKRKDALDQYYTDPLYAEYFYNKVDKLLQIDTYDVLLEPSAGSGSFFNLFDPLKRIGIDTDPKCAGVIKQSFYDWHPEIPYGKILTMGNPPYGRQSRDAINTFNYAATFSSAIAFVLPRSFMKSGLQNKLSVYFHLCWEEIVPKNSFIFNNCPVDVNTVSQVWVKKNYKRTQNDYHTKYYFDFVTYYDTYDFVIRRIGYHAGKLNEIVNESAKGQFIFIKTHSTKVRHILESLNFDDCKNQTGGGYAISKKDISTKFLNYLTENNIKIDDIRYGNLLYLK